MNPKIWIPLSAATITGAVAAWAGYQLVLQQPEVSRGPQVLLDPVVVASRRLPAGTRLGAADLTVLKMERGTVPGSPAEDPSGLIGRVLSESVAEGQLMSPRLLAAEGTIQGLGATLPSGYRAITIRVDPYSGLEGFLVPEARVDVIAALGNGNDAAARTVAQNLRVLAVAGRLQGESVEQSGEERAAISNEHNVTLMVTPEQAAAIELACDEGTPRLMLRSGSDTELHPFAGLTLAELRGESFQDPFQTGKSPWETDPAPMKTLAEPDENSPATRPSDTDASQQPETPMPRMHIVEIIRGGVISRTALPVGAAPEPARQPVERAVANTDTRPAAD